MTSASATVPGGASSTKLGEALDLLASQASLADSLADQAQKEWSLELPLANITGADAADSKANGQVVFAHLLVPASLSH